MIHTRLWIVAGIIALVVIIGFALSVPRARDGAKPLSSAVALPSVPTVTLRDVFKKGVHTITGSLTAPNACASVSANASLGTGVILVDISMPADTAVCLQVPTRATFQTTLSAPANLPFTVTVNGTVASTSVL